MVDRLDFDQVTWGSHCVDCWPAICPYRVYVRDGRVVREEVAGTLPTLEPGVPDMNPLGCQKGAAWARQLDAPDRLLHPLRRVGERGSGQWEQLSWDDALAAIADALIDTLETDGSESIVHEGSPEAAVIPSVHRFMGLIGGVITDINASINDLAVGHHLTFGTFYPVASPEDVFHSDVVIIWNHNPAYTNIPFFHAIPEMRYRGGEVVLIAPDVSPTHSHADYHVPLEWGSDPALALSMCQVVIAEGLVDESFVATQTDLSLLVRCDTERFLRQSDLEAGGSDEIFYHLRPDGGIAEASRATLVSDFLPVLKGSAIVTFASGESVEVRPLMVRLAAQLEQDYRPEQTQPVTSVHPETVRTIARKVAKGRTKVLMGMSATKTYHSDLYQRTMNLLLALTGNWGRKGTGINCWAAGLFDGQMTAMAKQRPGVEGAEDVLNGVAMMKDLFKSQDPTLTDELAGIELFRQLSSMGSRVMFPAFFLWYWHGGFQERWNTPEWNDASMPRLFDEYFDEAMAKGWWHGLDKPGRTSVPRVLIECGGNQLRRTRGGQGALFPTLWAQLQLVLTIDVRMSTTAFYSDIVLPAAQHYEKVLFPLASAGTQLLTLADKAVEPAGEAKEEWEIFALLCRAVADRAAARGLETFRVGSEGDAIADPDRRYDELWAKFTLGGHLLDSGDVAEEMLRDSVHSGNLPDGTTLDTMRDRGWVRFTDWGSSPMDKGQSSPWPVNETHVAFRNHVELGHPYPTLTRRAQFLIEHPWYVEAGEDLPVHRSPPKMGGDRPFCQTSGHNRWSIHSMNMGNPLLLGTHRGEPHAVMHPSDAARLGLSDGSMARVFNDVGEYCVPIKTSPAQRPRGLTIYNGWDGLMFRGHKGSNEVEPGMVKWLNMAGGYGHLRYSPMEWQPVPIDRPIFVSVEVAPTS